jgi:hypothetical protein
MSQLEHACRLRCGGLAISRDDIEFLRNAASRVAQGLRAARLLVRFESPGAARRISTAVALERGRYTSRLRRVVAHCPIPTPVSYCSSLELGFGAFGRDRPLGYIVLNFRLIGGCVTLPPLTKNGPAQ